MSRRGGSGPRYAVTPAVRPASPARSALGAFPSGVTTDVGRIEGTIAGTGGSPAAEAWVVAFSDDPDHWFQGSPFVYLTRTLGDLPSWSPSPPAGAPARREPGSFVVPFLAPGRYYVAAVEASTSGNPPQDRDALEKLRDRARLVTVTAGQTATVQIRLDKP